MSEVRAAYRYALSLLSVAEELKTLDKVSSDVDYLEKLIKESREFSLFLKSPVVSKEKKKVTLRTILHDRVSKLTYDFLLLLLSKDREGLLPEIIDRFYRLRDESLGILDVNTRSAVAFTKAQEKELTDQLERVTKKQIRLKNIIDPSLKGGFSVQFDDTVWDASVRHQLETILRWFAEA